MYDDLDQRIRIIYQNHYHDVYYFLLYFTGNQTDAEDLTQDVFMKLLRALPKYDGRAELKTWIFSIAKYLAIDSYRKKRFQAMFSENFLARLVSSEGRPEESLTAKEEGQELKEALQKLKPQYRMVVILRALKEYSVKETAEILGISESKVKVDFHRALKMLHTYLDKPVEGGWQNEWV